MVYNITEVINVMQEYVSKRISDLRISKGVSARDMSLSLGQNASYINRIENKKALPSLTMLTYICEYLGISLSEFFDEGNILPGRLREVNEELRKLTPAQIDIILSMAKEFTKKK